MSAAGVAAGCARCQACSGLGAFERSDGGIATDGRSRCPSSLVARSSVAPGQAPASSAGRSGRRRARPSTTGSGRRCSSPSRACSTAATATRTTTTRPRCTCSASSTAVPAGTVRLYPLGPASGSGRATGWPCCPSTAARGIGAPAGAARGGAGRRARRHPHGGARIQLRQRARSSCRWAGRRSASRPTMLGAARTRPMAIALSIDRSKRLSDAGQRRRLVTPSVRQVEDRRRSPGTRQPHLPGVVEHARAARPRRPRSRKPAEAVRDPLRRAGEQEREAGKQASQSPSGTPAGTGSTSRSTVDAEPVRAPAASPASRPGRPCSRPWRRPPRRLAASSASSRTSPASCSPRSLEGREEREVRAHRAVDAAAQDQHLAGGGARSPTAPARRGRRRTPTGRAARRCGSGARRRSARRSSCAAHRMPAQDLAGPTSSGPTTVSSDGDGPAPIAARSLTLASTAAMPAPYGSAATNGGQDRLAADDDRARRRRAAPRRRRPARRTSRRRPSTSATSPMSALARTPGQRRAGRPPASSRSSVTVAPSERSSAVVDGGCVVPW